MKPIRRQMADGSVMEGRPAWWYALVVQWWRVRFLATGHTPTIADIKRAFDRSARWRTLPPGSAVSSQLDGGSCH